MLKRIHWTIGHGGGEYGSEDSADDSDNSDDDGNFEDDALPRSKSWAESLVDWSNGNKVDKDMEVLRAMLTRTEATTVAPAQHENFRGELSKNHTESKHAEIATKNLVDEITRSKRPHLPNPAYEGKSKAQKNAIRQKLKRQRKSAQKCAKQAEGKSIEDSEESHGLTDKPTVPTARKVSKTLAKKLSRLNMDDFAVENEHGLKRYRSPHFPDKTFFSAEQLVHHMTTKKYQAADKRARKAAMSEEQIQKIKEKKAMKRARKAQQNNNPRGEEPSATTRSTSK